jgi:dihydrofolate reductase
MSKLRVHYFRMSLDGYGAGPSQSRENPLGVGGPALHEWAFKTRTFHAIHDKDGGETGVDDDFVARGFGNIGAWIIGRNMFGPVRGPGRTTLGRDGGATSRRFALLSSC